MVVVMRQKQAIEALQNGTAPIGLHVDGDINFQRLKTPPQFPVDCFINHLWLSQVSGDIIWPAGFRCKKLWITDCPDLTSLPSQQTMCELFVARCPLLIIIPQDSIVSDNLEINDCSRLTQLPSIIHVTRLVIANCPALRGLPKETRVFGEFALEKCAWLEELPDSLEASQISISGCQNVPHLPQGIQAHYIDVSHCTTLEAWDDPAITTLRQLDARGCRNLRQLPPNLCAIDQLDLSGCEQFAELPPELVVREWLDIGGTQITALPQSSQPYSLRWNGVQVPGQVAFHPTTISASMILSETNLEVRRIMVERVGLERFLAEANPDIRDHDTDPGGQRRLLAVAMPNDDEALVILQVQDPSTGRKYLIRVPPTMQTCHQSAAWIAGFKDPNAYTPVAES